MTTLHEAAMMALEALENGKRVRACEGGTKFQIPLEDNAMTALRAALAQQDEPVEPVAWYQKRGQEVLTSHPACWGREDEPWTPLYPAPPQRDALLEALKKMRIKYGEYACRVCDQADAAIKAVEETK